MSKVAGVKEIKKKGKTLTVGPPCQHRHCGDRVNPGAMAEPTLPPWPLHRAPLALWPPWSLRAPPTTACSSSPPFSPTCRNPKSTAPWPCADQAAAARRRRCRLPGADRLGAKEPPHLLLPPRPSNRTGELGIVPFFSISSASDRRPPSTLPSSSAHLCLRRASIRAQGEHAVLLDISASLLSP